jgi:uncharacterized protein (DUF2147 family)
MTATFSRHLIFFILCFIVKDLFAQSPPVGLWKTFDDESGKPKSLVRIVERQGRLNGSIERLLDPSDPIDAKCDLCPDDRRNQPILGLVILRNFGPSDGKMNRWEGGDILDPENGKIYRAHLTLSEDRRQLDVRGYIGISIIGRTQHWLRAD